MNVAEVKTYENTEEGIKDLKEIVTLRDKMGGAMYWNMLNDDCMTIANKLLRMGVKKEDLSPILGEGTFQ